MIQLTVKKKHMFTTFVHYNWQQQPPPPRRNKNTQPTHYFQSLMVVTPVSGAMNLTNYVNSFYSWNFIDRKFVLYFSYHRNASSQKQLALWFSSSFKNVKLLTAWRSLHNDGRQPMAIGHLSDFLFIKKNLKLNC